MRYMVKHNPLRNTGFLNDFDSLFGNFLSDSALLSNSKPAVDIAETKAEYILEVDLPGLSEKDVEVKVEENLLTISTKKEEKKEEEQKTYIMKERKSSSFARSFVLPSDTDVESISAAFKQGILTLNIKKSEKAKPKSIDIKTN